MQRTIFLVVFLIIFFIMFLANRFVVSRGIWALENTNLQTTFKVVFWVLPALFFIGQIMERFHPMWITKVITTIGSVWLGWFLYAFLIAVIIGVLQLLGKWFSWDWLIKIPKLTVFTVIFFGLLTLVVYGIINANTPVVKTHDITLSKSMTKPLKIAMVSDLHIGAIHGRNRIEKLVGLINAQQPDLVLIAGDLVDHNPKFGIKDKVGEAFEQLNSTFGTFAVTGNHEYIGEAEVSIEYLSEYGIRYLRDEYVVINNQLIIVGREDKDMQRFNGHKRLSLENILNGVDKNLPIFLMDHQPVEYHNVADQLVDLMVSGHTHKGQLWPNSYITKRVYENHHGLMQKGQTWFYTSNGYGTWGPPLRIGNRPEVVLINISN